MSDIALVEPTVLLQAINPACADGGYSIDLVMGAASKKNSFLFDECGRNNLSQVLVPHSTRFSLFACIVFCSGISRGKKDGRYF